MGNHAYKKEQAIIFNENRAYEKKCAEELAQDKIDHPEKYARRNRRVMQGVMPYIAMAAAAGVKI